MAQQIGVGNSTNRTDFAGKERGREEDGATKEKETQPGNSLSKDRSRTVKIMYN